MGGLCDDPAQLVMRHEGGPAGCQRHNGVVHHLEQHGVEIDKISGDVDRGDLALPVLQDDFPPGEPGEQQAAMARPAVFDDQLFTTVEAADAGLQGLDQGSFLRRQIVPLLDVPDEVLENA